MRRSAMGDVAMAVPVLRAFVEQHPDVRVTVISRSFLKPLFEDIPHVVFFAFEEKRHRGLWGLWRLFRELKALKVDAFADFHNVLRSKIVRHLFALSGTKTAVLDKGRADKKALTRPENKVFLPLKHSAERYADVLRELGFSLDLSHPRFHPAPPLKPAVVKLTGEKSGKWIGIAPFAQHVGKVYPEDLMRDVIAQLASNPNFKIFLFGGGAEKATLDTWAEIFKNAINTAGILSFSDEIALIQNLDLMLSMDSGNGHLAAINGVKTVTLWGATHPFLGFLPFAQPMESALIADRHRFPKLPSSVYGNKVVPGYEEAMRTISPESVVAKVLSRLSE